MTTNRSKPVKKYTIIKSQFCDTNIFECHNCFLHWRKLKLPKIFKNMNKTPNSTFFHVTSHTPTQIFPCIKVLLAF